MDSRPLRLMPALFIAALASSFLPLIRLAVFETVYEEHGVNLTARDLLLGRLVTVASSNGREHTLRFSPSLFVTIAFAAFIAGFLVSLFPGWKNRAAASVFAAVACSCLYQFQLRFGFIAQSAEWPGEPEYQPAFYVLLALFVSAACAGLPFALMGRGFSRTASLFRRRRTHLKEGSEPAPTAT